MKHPFQGIAGWQTVFLAAGVLDVIVVLLFVIMAKAEVQPWALATITTTKLTTTTTAAKETDRLLASSRISLSRTGYGAGAGDVDGSGQVMLHQAEGGPHSDHLTRTTQHL